MTDFEDRVIAAVWEIDPDDVARVAAMSDWHLRLKPEAMQHIRKLLNVVFEAAAEWEREE